MKAAPEQTLDGESIPCPHCDARYQLGRVNPYPSPFICLRCGRKMYDGRQYLIPIYTQEAGPTK